MGHRAVPGPQIRDLQAPRGHPWSRQEANRPTCWLICLEEGTGRLERLRRYTGLKSELGEGTGRLERLRRYRAQEREMHKKGSDRITKESFKTKKDLDDASNQATRRSEVRKYAWRKDRGERNGKESGGNQRKGACARHRDE